MNKRFWFTAIFCMIAGVTACNDDSGDSNKDDNLTTKVALGEACDNDAILCEDGLYCEDRTCVAHVNKGDSCDNTHICITGLVCKDTCVEENGGGGGGGEDDKNKGKAGAACTGDDNCESPLVCDGDECRAKSNLGGACVTDKSCRQGTCVNEICSEYSVETGDECDPGAGKLCVQDENELVCSKIASMCYPVAKAGEMCFSGVQDCEAGYECSPNEGKCLELKALGEDCGVEQGLGCTDGLECINGKCRSKVRDNCNDYAICESATAICYDGKCIETHTCEDDEGCHADTYCCTEEACLVKHVCLAYGTGPRLNENEFCKYKTASGIFEADLQCEWTGPGSDDVLPESKSVSSAVMVAPTPHETGSANTLFVLTYKQTPSIGDPVLRLINGENCQLLETIYDPDHLVSTGGVPSLVDVDGDGIVEIFAYQFKKQASGSGYEGNGIVSFKWSDTDKKYVFNWENTSLVHNNLKCVSGHGCENIYTYDPMHNASVHDLNDDGIPEVITPFGEVLDSRTGEKINGDQSFESTVDFPVLGDLDNDGKIEYVDHDGSVYEWEIKYDADKTITSQGWVLDYPRIDTLGNSFYHQIAVADMGTPGDTPEAFDWTRKDGIAEVIANSPAARPNSKLVVYTLISKPGEDGTVVKSQQRVLYLDKLHGGGFPTVGDFDNDTMPEIGVAFGDHYRVIDPGCVEDGAGNLPKECHSKYILWEGYNKDVSSFSTGSSIFDFDGDGQSEVVYADECFSRIYDGKTGDILFSSSHYNTTGKEYPVIADVDNDGSAEIIIPETSKEHSCDTIDSHHRGIRCTDNSDCTSKVCEDGFCRCTSDDQCNWRKSKDGTIKDEYKCDDPIEADKAINPKQICRAQHPKSQAVGGIRVLRERYDRWVSARPVWNQFSYSVTNINDNMSIPRTSEWKQNFLTPNLNNYRANSQGNSGRDVAPDITCKLDKSNVCVTTEKEITLNGVICNRGTKMVAALMPASFYEVKENGELGDKYCTSYTSSNVPVGDCLPVSCSITKKELKNVSIRMIANDDGDGGRTTVECNPNNNTDEVTIEGCAEN